ncbi:MAG: GspE/PulE family protein [Planctomycetes bacterium]|nr:GspE/PulE family protein [Planctomycetota bacterium]
MPTLSERFEQQRSRLDESDPQYVPQLVEVMLVSARDSGASDVHLIPAEDRLAMHWRIDGVLHEVASFPRRLSAHIVSRLKVLAELLTYKTDVPQEGRIRTGDASIETRVSTFPTLYGEKAVVRLFVGSGSFRRLDDLGLPDEALGSLRELLAETGGALVASGPAGSGKTTTLYAALRELAERSPVRRSLVTLEDPIEAVVEGAAQSQVRPAAGFDYETGLKSLLRQDPDVIMVGEIRDRPTAELVFGASLTGHLVLTTFHAGSAAEAVGRLLDMGLEAYQLRSGLLAVLNQRLVRRLCACAESSERPEDRLGLDVDRVRLPVGCHECGGTGYRGRLLLAEMLVPGKLESPAVVSAGDTAGIEQRAIQAGMVPRHDRGRAAVAAGLTSPAEVRRVFGFR